MTLIQFFYQLSIFFIVIEILSFAAVNKATSLKVTTKTLTVKDVVFALLTIPLIISQILYVIWGIAGLFTDLQIYFYLLLILSLIKFGINRLFKNFYLKYENWIRSIDLILSVAILTQLFVKTLN
jgi:uncharacterized membrane protein